jgi:hypothetical protein
MPNHQGLGPQLCTSAEDVADAYRDLRAAGYVPRDEDARMLRATGANVAISAQVALTLIAIATIARCALDSRHAHAILAQWEATDLARAALGGRSLRETIEQRSRQSAA